MIIEGAFFKLPDYFLSKDDASQYYESYLISYFTLAIFLELQNRGVNNPFLNIQMDKPYPKEKNKRVDIYVNIPWLSAEKVRSSAEGYGIFKENWIEVKFFGGKGSAKGKQTKTENIGAILNDILRLKFYAPWNSGRYCLIGFNRKPEEYLAFYKKKTKERRNYLCKLFEVGEHDIEFDLSEEPNSLINKIKVHENVLEKQKFKLRVLTLVIKPSEESDNQCFWLYLIKIKI